MCHVVDGVFAIQSATIEVCALALDTSLFSDMAPISSLLVLATVTQGIPLAWGVAEEEFGGTASTAGAKT
jgi:hypothetical protein